MTVGDSLEQRLLGGPRELRRREVSRAAGVSLLSARKLWRALGFANVEDAELAFTRADLAELERVAGLVRTGQLDEETAIALTRALGHTADRLVSWQVEALIEHVQRTQGHDPVQARRGALALLDSMEPDLEQMLRYAWRRQLAAAVARLAVDDEAHAATGSHPLPDDPAVGFADLVGFTRLAERLDERDLARLVQRFEGLAADVVAAGGGRLVKTVGDEALYLARNAASGARIGLDLAREIGADDLVPAVRVGLVSGPVLMRLGDVFGTSVNLASRLTGIAAPGTVLTDGATAAMLEGKPGILLAPQRPRQLRGLGTVSPVLVQRAATGRHSAPD